MKNGILLRSAGGIDHSVLTTMVCRRNLYKVAILFASTYGSFSDVSVLLNTI